MAEVLQPYYDGTTGPLRSRSLSQETCERYGYRTGKLNGSPVQFAPYYKEGQVVAAKVRGKDKEFKVIGEGRKLPLFGQHLQTTGKMLVVTEGEIDAMSVSQALGHKWPCVSVPTGAKGALGAFKDNIDYLKSFEKVVLFFDNDEPGQAAVKECAQVLPAGTAFIVSVIGAKDANDMLKQDRVGDLVKAIWNAQAYRPDHIITIADIIDKACADPVMGYPWFIDELTKETYGRNDGDVITLGAGVGVGKTDFVTQQIEYDLSVLKQGVAVFALEQDPVETVRRIAGKHVGKILHIPDPSITPEDRRTAIEAVQGSGRFFMYDSWGVADWDAIESKIEYLSLSEGVKFFYVDHLTALAAMEDDEKKAIEQIMARAAGMANKLNIVLLFVSHLATPEGKSHEEGGRVMAKHFKGSRAIAQWSHLMLGIERNQQDDDQKNQALLRCLKDRKTGRATGLTIPLFYDRDTGRLSSVSNPF